MMQVSYMEIYNEQVMDLLVPANERTNLKVGVYGTIRCCSSSVCGGLGGSGGRYQYWCLMFLCSFLHGDYLYPTKELGLPQGGYGHPFCVCVC
jgi:hypothetical protein